VRTGLRPGAGPADYVPVTLVSSRDWRRAAGIASAVAVTVAAAGCGGTAGTSSTPTTSSPAATTTSSTTHRRSRPPRRPRRPAAQGAAIGTAQRVNAGTSTLSVTVTKVVDPLTASGAATLPGTRPVGVELTVRNEAGATYDSSASGDVSLVTSTGAAAPLFIKQGVCATPLTDFESLIGVGESHTGCVGFSVANGARIVSVRFSPHSRSPGSVAWR
jgi:hypothetical protein